MLKHRNLESSVNIDEIISSDNPAKQAAAQGKLTKELIHKEYKDCFDKVGRFPIEKYHIQLIDNPVPVIHAPRTVLVHILPLYRAELDKMLADDIVLVFGSSDVEHYQALLTCWRHVGRTMLA